MYEYTKETLIKIKEERIEGIYYWEPLWIPGKNICWASKTAQKISTKKENQLVINGQMLI